MTPSSRVSATPPCREAMLPDFGLMEPVAFIVCEERRRAKLSLTRTQTSPSPLFPLWGG
jgi:hypothetical protein